MDSATTASVPSTEQNTTKSPDCIFSCPCVKDILTWKNTVATASVLSGINLTFIVFWASSVSLFSLICLIGLVTMLIGFVVSIMMSENKEQRIEVVTKVQMEEAAICAYDKINSLATKLHCLLLWKNHAASAKACVFLGAMSYISTWLSVKFLAFLGINTLFFCKQISTAYEKYASPHLEKAVEIVKTYIKKIPKMTAPPSHSKTN